MFQKKMLFLLLWALPVWAQAQQVKVCDLQTRQHIELVALFNPEQSKVQITDSLGRATIDEFAPNETIILRHTSFLPYETTKKQILEQGDTVFLQKRQVKLSEMTLSAPKLYAKPESEVFLRQEIRFETEKNLAPTSAEVLVQSGNISVQKSQGGGGSPIIRGFEANKILLVVDGVRLNNAIYRNGHLQNSITIDPAVLEKVDVLFGTASVMYGSDALGGVVNYTTKSPKMNDSLSLVVRGYAEYGTASQNQAAHLNVEVQRPRWASLSAFSVHNFGDIRMGKQRREPQSDYGLTHHYARRVGQTDSMFQNPDPFVQKKTGYQQYDWLQKVKFRPSGKTEITANIQYSTSSKIHRYDRLNDYSPDGKLKYAEWYYGPQNRLLAALKTALFDRRLFDKADLIVSFQQIDEDRFSRRFGNLQRLAQQEDVQVYSATADFFKENRFFSLRYGTEMIFNRVGSSAFYKNIETQATTPAQTRYPEQGSFTQTYGVYFNYKWSKNPHFTLDAGFRYSFFALHSEFGQSPFVNLPFEEINLATGAPTASLGAIWRFPKNFRLNVSASTGFRAPNVDDYGKIRAKNGMVSAPASGLKPEYAYNIELGLQKRFSDSFSLNLIGFNTYLTNAIVRSFGSLNGNDSLLYDGEMYRITQNINAGRAVVRGLALNMGFKTRLKACRSLNFAASLNYTYGKDLSNNVPLGHIPPLFGRTRLQFETKKWGIEAIANYNGQKTADNFSPYGEDNLEEALWYGYPAWATLDMRFFYAFSPQVKFTFAIENIFDTHYKRFASGVSEPGRNFLFRLYFRLG